MNSIAGVQLSWKTITGVIDLRERLLAIATRPADEPEFAFSDDYLHLIATTSGAVAVSNEGRRMNLAHEWVVELDQGFAVADWEDASQLAAGMLKAALWARILNAPDAIAIPGTWTAHPTLQTTGAGIYAFIDEDDDTWIFRPGPTNGLGLYCGRYVEVGREWLNGTLHTLLVRVDNDEEDAA